MFSASLRRFGKRSEEFVISSPKVHILSRIIDDDTKDDDIGGGQQQQQ
jgi:hypothetical protein